MNPESFALRYCLASHLLLFVWPPGWCPASAAPLTSTEALLHAVRTAEAGAVIELAAGTFELPATLELPGDVTLTGAGMDQTILTHVRAWKADPAGLPDPEMKLEGLDTSAYLIRIQRDTRDVHLSHFTLHAPGLHGCIFAWFHTGLDIHQVRIRETMGSGLRTFGMKEARIHECEFIDAGGRWSKGAPGVKGGITGGGIFACWMADSEISHNRFLRTRLEPQHEFYGIKVRQARHCRVHHNTIETNFSLEFPFENDEGVEVDHNVLYGTVSIPKHAGGPVPESGRTFHIHHNLFRDSYSIEFVRNGVEMDHNLFDFDPQADHGNLISAFGNTPAAGPAVFHNNRVNNPGRGVIWMNEPYANLDIHHNHIVCRPTATPRREGLFGFNPASDFATFRFRDNRVECLELARPLFRNPESQNIRMENNVLVNVTEAERLRNPSTGNPAGLEAPLSFDCGVHGEVRIRDGRVIPMKP